MDKNSKDSVCSSIDWLSRNLMYYLRIDKCGCRDMGLDS